MDQSIKIQKEKLMEKITKIKMEMAEIQKLLDVVREDISMTCRIKDPTDEDVLFNDALHNVETELFDMIDKLKKDGQIFADKVSDLKIIE